MESLIRFLLLSLLLHSILLVKCDDEEDNLLQEINSYRTSLNLTALTKNDKAECLADEMADQFKNQPCTNSTGSNTVPGTEPRFSDFPSLLSKCHLNVTVTRDGQILPACVPDLVPSVVASNFTKSQYSGYLNDTKYTGVGIGSENDWIVVVLTTSTPEGSFTPDNNTANLQIDWHLILQRTAYTDDVSHDDSDVSPTWRAWKGSKLKCSPRMPAC
ncbi:putative GPI-anchored protein [Abeliophyllum distichum]|uniref:GPI-anchored protein n=1 Tax=Abeliophyllum distichum TaxID=126358 RepID=A0ABD1Q168_9LAMI